MSLIEEEERSLSRCAALLRAATPIGEWPADTDRVFRLALHPPPQVNDREWDKARRLAVHLGIKASDYPLPCGWPDFSVLDHRQSERLRAHLMKVVPPAEHPPTPILVIDLEATCADDGSISPEQMEIIEVGACWATPDGEVLDRFQRFVRPLYRPRLTPFCMELTGIFQEQVDAAGYFPEVAAALAKFARQYRKAESFWGSWGDYDRRQIERDCARHGVANPLEGMPHQNLKRQFAKGQGIKAVGMATALKIAGLSLEGAHHRALDDALNIARLLPWSMISNMQKV